MGRISCLQPGQRHNRQLQRLLVDSGENLDGALVVRGNHGRWVFPTPSEFRGLDETSPWLLTHRNSWAWHSICEAIDVGEAGVSKTYSCWGSKIQSSWKMSIPRISIRVILPFHANLPDTYQGSKGRIESHQRCSKKTQREQTKENGFHGIRIRLCGRGV